MKSVQSSDVEVEAEIAELVETVRQAKSQIADVEAELKPVIEQAKDRIGYLLAVRGSNWKDEEGYAQLVAGAQSTKWNTKALEQLILQDPDKYGWLAQYRTEVTGDPQVRVK